MRTLLTATAIAGLLSGCATMRTPENIEDAADGRAYQPHYAEASARDSVERRHGEMPDACPVPAAAPFAPPTPMPAPLSIGDLLAVAVGDDEVLSGDAEIGADGRIALPHLSPVAAHGRDPAAVERAIAERLVAERLYRRAPRVSVRLRDPAAAMVHVGGAVFEPGPKTVGHVAGAERDGARQAALGGPAGGRTLSAALRAAGGIRPDADLSRVVLERAGRTRTFDLNGAFTGGAFEDAVLVAGDRVSVPSRGCFQAALMRPNPVSPPGITVHMSNLTQPARANAPSAIGQHVREMPYGARFLQAVFSMNCMGGAAATNADRYAVLFSRNPVTGHSVVIERRLEELLRRADRDVLDPYLLPGDAVACYDSAVTNLTEVARAIGTIAATGFLVSL